MTFGLAGLFDDEEFVPWNKPHLDALVVQWGKLTKQHKMYDFNMKWYRDYISSRGDNFVRYLAGLQIPHLSALADQEKLKRGI